MILVLRWLTAFGRFWYHFIIGDDWTVAAAVAVGLVVTWLLHNVALSVWWLVPVTAAAVVGLSLRRTAGRR